MEHLRQTREGRTAFRRLVGTYTLHNIPNQTKTWTLCSIPQKHNKTRTVCNISWKIGHIIYRTLLTPQSIWTRSLSNASGNERILGNSASSPWTVNPNISSTIRWRSCLQKESVLQTFPAPQKGHTLLFLSPWLHLHNWEIYWPSAFILQSQIFYTSVVFIIWLNNLWLILGLHTAIERRRYKVTMSLIGWV